MTGVGAGQFKNYDPQGREQPWRESHNIVLQVAAELGIGGVVLLFFLVSRAVLAAVQAQRLLRLGRGLRRRGRTPAPPAAGARPPRRPSGSRDTRRH